MLHVMPNRAFRTHPRHAGQRCGLTSSDVPSMGGGGGKGHVGQGRRKSPYLSDHRREKRETVSDKKRAEKKGRKKKKGRKGKKGGRTTTTDHDGQKRTTNKNQIKSQMKSFPSEPPSDWSAFRSPPLRTSPGCQKWLSRKYAPRRERVRVKIMIVLNLFILNICNIAP